MTSLVNTLTETLRYRGAIGQWSWVLHRLSGLGVVLFLVIHVIDTSWAVFYPEEYVKAIFVYQTPLFTIGEFILVAAVVYHALNGLRIIVMDYRPSWWKYQKAAANAVLIGTAVILLPVFALMLGHVVEHYSHDPFILPLGEVIASQIPFIVGIVLAIIAAMLLSGLYGMIAGESAEKVTGKGSGSKLERFWWSFMRLSGVLIVPLVFGHLAVMHIVQGVFDLQVVNAVEGGLIVAGTGMQNVSGTAVEFVKHRWDFLVGGVAIWRIYDTALLALVTVHGFNGLRYVFTDYVQNETIKRGLIYLCVIGAVVLLVTGGGALLLGVNEDAIQLAQQSLLEIVASH